MIAAIEHHPQLVSPAFEWHCRDAIEHLTASQIVYQPWYIQTATMQNIMQSRTQARAKDAPGGQWIWLRLFCRWLSPDGLDTY